MLCPAGSRRRVWFRRVAPRPGPWCLDGRRRRPRVRWWCMQRSPGRAWRESYLASSAPSTPYRLVNQSEACLAREPDAGYRPLICQQVDRISSASVFVECVETLHVRFCRGRCLPQSPAACQALALALCSQHQSSASVCPSTHDTKRNEDASPTTTTPLVEVLCIRHELLPSADPSSCTEMQAKCDKARDAQLCGRSLLSACMPALPLVDQGAQPGTDINLNFCNLYGVLWLMQCLLKLYQEAS